MGAARRLARVKLPRIEMAHRSGNLFIESISYIKAFKPCQRVSVADIAAIGQTQNHLALSRKAQEGAP